MSSEERQIDQTAPRACLLGLPREIRDQVLEHVLLSPAGLTTVRRPWLICPNNVPACPPSVCRVDRQLRAESLPVFLSSNIFEVDLASAGDNVHAFGHWLDRIGYENAHNIRYLKVLGWIQIPFGHMVQRRWLVASFDFKAKTMSVNGKSTLENSQMSLLSPVQELQTAFEDLLRMREGGSLEAQDLRDLIERFHGLSIAY
ncbi:hypothetical protein Slin15195_G123330 [Septoria linicola]|uniref:F-box domain-containing protein n=1 Tax=Septoria linicola TaxID=215465 RepID=A0A9Q9B123_9PEZI|nr:hypothetical protein Slin14017_G079530 [Septoria linicola]USW59014.1 hypothetical protein Slin15195_G123330 [Septoria linicola]